MDNRIRLDLRAILYREDNWWIAHCLELDIPAEGDSPQDALATLVKLVAVHVDAALDEGDLESIFTPAPPRFWRLYALATKKRRMAKAPPPSIGRLEVREMELA